MLRADASGRVPFALVAVLLLLSAGVSAMYAAKRAHDEADARMREARLAALNAVADDVHREVLSQAQYVAVDAVARGTDGLVNASKVNDGFQAGFAAYVASHFPRVVRGVVISMPAYDAGLALVERRVADTVPSNATRVESVAGIPLEAPDLAAPDAVVPIDRLAYFTIRGFVNYTLTLDGVTMERPAPLATLVPVPAPLMATKLAQVTRSGEGDLAGIGRTVKAILASVVQVRILDGVASRADPGTTTRDVLTPADVELAVNLAVLLEEVRRFRAYDRDAAAAIDATHAPPEIPAGVTPPTADRTLVRLLDRYAADGTLDATDLYALYTGLDAKGVSLASVFAQAIAALADNAVLKGIDFLGLTPLADWLAGTRERLANWVDDFWRWATNASSREAEYVHRYLGAVFLDTGTGTGFFGSLDFPLPTRAYDVPNGTGSVRITIPAHAATIPFPPLDLLAKAYDPLWESYFPRLKSRVGAVDASLRGLVNDVAARVATDAVLDGLLPATAFVGIDPKDNASFLDALAYRVAGAVDRALDHFRSDPYAVDALTADLWNATKALLGDLVSFLGDRYDAANPALVGKADAIAFAYRGIVDDLATSAARDPHYASLNATQRTQLGNAIGADVAAHGWNATAYADREDNDTATWGRALDLADGATQPGAHLREQIREQVVGASGWLVRAAGSVKGLVSEAALAQGLGGSRAAIATPGGPFVLADPWAGGPATTEAFRVRQSPAYLRVGPGTPGAGPVREGGLRVAIGDPADVPPTDDTPNVHYTKPGADSPRPFTTQWTVRLDGALRVRVETALPVLLGPRGLEPAGVEASWPLNVTLEIPAYSGWNLTGVRYRASDTFFSEIVGFLDVAFDALQQVLRWAIDVLRKALEVLREFVGQMFDLVTKVVRLLSDIFSHFVDLLRSLAAAGLVVLGRLLDTARGIWPAGEPRFTVHASGVRFTVDLFGGNGRSLVLEFDLLGHGRIEFVRLADSEFDGPAYRGRVPAWATYDAFASWNATLGPLRQSARFDPLNLTLGQGHMLEGNASWDGSWHADFAGPDVASAVLVRQAVPFTVFLPTGTEIDGEVGAEVLVTGHPVLDLVAAVERALHEGLAAVGVPRSWRDVGRIVRAIAERLREGVLDVVEREIVSAGVFLKVRVTEAGAGGGVKFAFLVDGTAARALMEWVIDNAVPLLEYGPNPFLVLEHPPPPAVLEHTWFRVEGSLVIAAPAFLAGLGVEGEIAVEARVQVNLAAIAHLLGRDRGRPVVGFGLLLDFQVRLPPFGADASVFLLRGSVVFG